MHTLTRRYFTLSSIWSVAARFALVRVARQTLYITHVPQTTKRTSVMYDIISQKTKLLAATQRIRLSHHHAPINKCAAFTYHYYFSVAFIYSPMWNGRTFFSIYSFSMRLFYSEMKRKPFTATFMHSKCKENDHLANDATNFRTADFCCDGVAMATP